MHYVDPKHWAQVLEKFGEVLYARTGCGSVALARDLTAEPAHVTCPGCLAVLEPEGTQWLTTAQAAERLGVDRSLLDARAPGAAAKTPHAVINVGMGQKRATWRWHPEHLADVFAHGRKAATKKRRSLRRIVGS